MSDADTSDQQKPPDNPQQLIGFMSNDEWDELLAYVAALIQEVEDLPLPEVKDKVFELLAGIDAIHREGLMRLVRLFKKGVLEQVVTDPPIHTLMEFYDLLPPNTGDSSLPVPAPKKSFANIPVHVNPSTPRRPIKQPKFPHWVPALKHLDQLAPGTAKEFAIDGVQVLICRVKDELFALESRCAQDGASLDSATLSQYTLTCANHAGCFYDVRQGTRIAAPGEISCYPVKLTDNAAVLVGMDMEFKPKLPTF